MMAVMQSRRLILRHALLSFLFVLFYLLLDRPEVILISQLGTVAWYPATGLVLALLLGVSPWYALLVVLCESLAGRLIYHQPLTSIGGTISSVGTAACYATAAYFLRGPLKIDLGLSRRRDVVLYVSVTAVAAIGSTLIGATCLVVDNAIPAQEFWPSAFVWFLGDEIGLLGVAPFLLIHVLPWVRAQIFPLERYHTKAISVKTTIGHSLAVLTEGTCQVGAILAVLWTMFGPTLGPHHLFYLGFVPIIWIATRQGVRRVVTGLLATNFGMALAIHAFPLAPAVLSQVGLLMLMLSAVGLFVGSTVTERYRIGLELQQQSSYLNSLHENSPLGIAVFDRQGRVELTNPALGKLFQYDQREFVGIDLDRILSPGWESGDSIPVTALTLAGETIHEIVKRRRKDGTILDIELHSVPLIVNGEVRGAYTLYEDISEQLKSAEAERQHAESLSQLVGELELRTRQMSLLSEMGSMLECCATTQEACAVVSRSIEKLFTGTSSGTLYLFQSSRNLVETAVHWAGASVSETQFTPNDCWALRRGQAQWSSCQETAIHCPHFSTKFAAKCLCVPMVGMGETHGVLLLEFDHDTDGGSSAGSEEQHESIQRLATTAAGQIALSLASLLLREKLRDQSIRDPMTGLFSRRFMEESLDRELLRASRKKQLVSVLLLDLDHFKKFNDTFGHDAGDLVLRSVAELFRNFFRAEDVICRYGGEEFTIILPESTPQNAASRAKALSEEVKKLKLYSNGEALGAITVSVGIASFPEDALSTHELMRAAERCLYESRNSGPDALTAATQRAGGTAALENA
jgi:diguanylate cyclase (GGDEF)-like protein/PAS domain S-box-containing protein